MQVAFHLFLPLVLLNEMQMAEYSTIFSTLSSSFQKIHHDIAVSLSFLTCHFFIDSCNSFFRTQFCQAMCECPACDFSLALWSVENPYRFQFQSYHFSRNGCIEHVFALLFVNLYSFIYYEISIDRTAEGVLSKHFISTSISSSHFMRFVIRPISFYYFFFQFLWNLKWVLGK